MRRKSKVSFPVSIGAASLLVAFLVLCIATFAGLTLSAAKSDENAAVQLAERRSAYYEASNRSESLVQLVANAAEDASGANWMQDAAASVEEKTLAMDSVEVSVEEEDGIPVISWEIATAQIRFCRWRLSCRSRIRMVGFIGFAAGRRFPADEWEAGGTKTMLPVIPE